MTSIGLYLATAFIAFPREGAVLPPVEKCYVIGSVEKGVTNLTVNGASVPVYRTGAWATRIDVAAGTNTLTVAYPTPRGGSTNEVTRLFRVSPRPPQPKSASTNQAAKVWEKLAYAADVARPHPQGKSPSEITVVLDPGHGGAKDRGATSPHGGDEKDANLLLARDVKSALESLGYRVILTRSDDRAIPLYERARPAHEMGADAFISIHHNAPAVNGDVASIRYSAVYAWNGIGERLAKSIANRMAAAQSPELPSRGALHANFAVTRSPEIPSCLIEADFITHPAGEAAAWDRAARATLGAAIASGFDDWCKSGAADDLTPRTSP